jgi:hypothetical protein
MCPFLQHVSMQWRVLQNCKCLGLSTDGETIIVRICSDTTILSMNTSFVLVWFVVRVDQSFSGTTTSSRIRGVLAFGRSLDGADNLNIQPLCAGRLVWVANIVVGAQIDYIDEDSGSAYVLSSKDLIREEYRKAF